MGGSRGFENCFVVEFEATKIRQRWVHTCMLLSGLDPNSKLAMIKIFIQGELKNSVEFETILDPDKDGNGIFILAQEQDSFGGGFDKKQSFNGKIAQVNMFERLKSNHYHMSFIFCCRILSEDEVLQMASCKANPLGDLISWSPEKWSSSGDVVLESSDETILCASPFKNTLTAISEPLTFDDASFTCDFLSGKIFNAESDDLYNKLKNNIELEAIDVQYHV